MADSVPTTIQDLKSKQKLTGTVKKIELVGAVVDIGLEQLGLIHISQLAEGRVNNVGDAVAEGQEVTVWVRRVDQEAGRIELTMLEPPDVTWDDLRVGQAVVGKVVRLEKFGAFVDIGAARPGLVHVSELAEGYVKAPSDVVNVGDEVEAKIIGVSRKKNRIDLSIKALSPTVPVEEEDEEDESVTAFALAYQRALMAEESQVVTENAEGAEAETGDRQRRMQDELLERTLEQHKTREG
jgi:ribosomal protein S1